MDTPTIAKYYREKDPMERLKLLEQSIAAGEEPEENRIRKELWEIRYSDKAETGDTRADGYLGLWMTMEFNRNSASRFFGTRSAKKEIGKYLKKLKFQVYMDLCQTDKSYNTMIFGLIHIKEDSAKAKVQRDIRETAVELPANLGMEAELGIITRAAREIYRQYYPNEGNI